MLEDVGVETISALNVSLTGMRRLDFDLPTWGLLRQASSNARASLSSTSSCSSSLIPLRGFVGEFEA